MFNAAKNLFKKPEIVIRRAGDVFNLSFSETANPLRVVNPTRKNSPLIRISVQTPQILNSKSYAR